MYRTVPEVIKNAPKDATNGQGLGSTKCQLCFVFKYIRRLYSIERTLFLFFSKILVNMKNKIRFKYLKTKHSWHLVDPSPWPLVASLGAFFMTSGTVLYMNKFLGGGQLAVIGFFVLLYVMYT
jgi:hypothetical protein